METLDNLEIREITGGQICLHCFDWAMQNPPEGPVYADGTGSGYPGEIWFP
ncbi:MAG: hypothetical protein H6558_07800 [Lewinellaceae bacterium]|nr:hypothetical protein [Lewinellaceae bacterium]MCB9291057.1 hypothetical protein [Lewinellaceae bacterium]